MNGYFHPDETFTQIEKKDSSNIVFPGLIKICIYPTSFSQTATDIIGIAGYGSDHQYFMGESLYNRYIIGWAGHTREGGVYGTVEGEFL